MIYKAFINVSRDSVKTNDYITFKNCGWSEKIHIGTRTYRPDGRNDYHILYLSKGDLPTKRDVKKLTFLHPILFYSITISKIFS